MDWLIDPHHPDVAGVVTARVREHLRRHAADPGNLHHALERVDGLVRSQLENGAGRPLWMHLDWAELEPLVSLRSVTPDTPSAVQAQGLDPAAVMDVPARHRHMLAAASEDRAADETGWIRLPVVRRRPPDFDPDLGTLADLDIDPARDGQAAVTVALVAAAEAHPAASANQLVALAGAAVADTAPSDPPLATAQDVADTFCRIHQDLGGKPSVVHVDDDTLELSLDRCLFGRSATHPPSLCGVSAGLVGRLAARASGQATVVLDETMALGDPACRLRVWLGEPDRPVAGVTYRWPVEAESAEEAAPRMALSVSLPRESGSVPVVRRLAAQALRAFGVTAEDIYDVELAITEACANVIEHAVDSDSYEVNVELASDHCAITVLDRGTGFDAADILAQAEDSEDGRGLAIMRSLVDNLAFHDEPQTGAVVHMVKSLRYDGSHPLHRDMVRD